MNSIKSQLVTLGFNDAQIALLARYEALIVQWQKAINLVSPSTLNDIPRRHILDSAQLWPVIQKLQPENPTLIDLGSGGGLPGIVLAIAGADVTMVESDQRKCIFLRETARELGLKNVTVITERIEKVSAVSAPIITARALASLSQLVEWARPLVQENGHMVFLKGQDWKSELQALEGSYTSETIPSITDKDARIVVLGV